MLLEDLPFVLKYENSIITLEISVTSSYALCLTYRSVFRSLEVPTIVIDLNSKSVTTLNNLLEDFKKTYEYNCLKDKDKESNIEDLYWASKNVPMYNIEVKTLKNAIEIMASWIKYALTIGYEKM